MTQTMTKLEGAVLEAMLVDPCLLPLRRHLDPLDPPRIVERNFSDVGFLSNFARDGAAKLFADDVSIRWGSVLGRINSSLDVDFVVYVDGGYVNCIEGVTFGGELWPSTIESFQLTKISRS